jgi:hypothetical protein
MFEKDAEEYLKKDGTKAEYILNMLNEISPLKIKIKQLPYILAMLQQIYQDGAEFGYNKCKEDADKMKSRFLELCNLKDMRIAELEKANEWHYNGVPKNENDILCQIDKDIFVVGYFHQKNKQYYTTSGEWLKTVIAWKEIVLPELPKESE